MERINSHQPIAPEQLVTWDDLRRLKQNKLWYKNSVYMFVLCVLMLGLAYYSAQEEPVSQHQQQVSVPKTVVSKAMGIRSKDELTSTCKVIEHFAQKTAVRVNANVLKGCAHSIVK